MQKNQNIFCISPAKSTLKIKGIFLFFASQQQLGKAAEDGRQRNTIFNFP